VIDLAHFILTALALLAAPGPTNALLATAGATQTVKIALPLLLAELLGYGVALLVLLLAVGPVATAHAAIGWSLRIASALYLAYLAVRLWGHRLEEYVGRAEVHFRQVLLATLLNPKSLILAFVLLPAPPGDAALPPASHLIALVGLIALTGGGWILLGAQVRSHAGEDVRLSTFRRAGAVAADPGHLELTFHIGGAANRVIG